MLPECAGHIDKSGRILDDNISASNVSIRTRDAMYGLIPLVGGSAPKPPVHRPLVQNMAVLRKKPRIFCACFQAENPRFFCEFSNRFRGDFHARFHSRFFEGLHPKYFGSKNPCGFLPSYFASLVSAFAPENFARVYIIGVTNLHAFVKNIFAKRWVV